MNVMREIGHSSIYSTDLLVYTINGASGAGRLFLVSILF